MTVAAITVDELARAQAAYAIFARFDRTAMHRHLTAPVPRGRLSGKVIGLKDNIALQGAIQAAGMAQRAQRVAACDAHVTRLLRLAGARLLPGLNMDEAALGGVTDNPHFGRTDNPRAPGHSAGGSSGGAAAAVAAGVMDAALGTDTLGSIRIPASYCGVAGLKPTAGLVGRGGIVPLSPSLDAVGPMAASCADLWPLIASLAGHDPDDPDSVPTPAGWAHRDERPMRIGLPDATDGVDVEPQVRAALHSAIAALRATGAEVVPVHVPGWDPSALRRAAFILTEHEGATALADDLARGDGFSQGVRGLLNFGRDLPARKLAAAVGEVRRAAMGLRDTFEQVDAIVTPTTPQRAIRAQDAAPANQADFTALANAAGVPAIAVPVQVPGETRPASVQLTGRAWSEAALIAQAVSLEAALIGRR